MTETRAITRASAKAKGRLWNTAICRYLIEQGWIHAEPRALRGSKDQGDVAGIPGVVIEAKNEVKIDLAGYLDEAEVERINAGAELGVAWVHRRGHASPANGYVVMSGATFARLLKAAGW